MEENLVLPKTRLASDLNTAERAYSFVVLFVPLVTLIMGGTIMAIMWLGGHYVVGGSMLSGDLIAFFTYASEILMSLMMVAMVMMVLTRSIACGKRIVEVLEEQPEITDSAADAALTVENGDVDFDHVYFKYHKDSDAWNLEDVCLHIDSGMTVGILGGTGSARERLDVQLRTKRYYRQFLPELRQQKAGTQAGGRKLEMPAVRRDGDRKVLPRMRHKKAGSAGRRLDVQLRRGE